MTGIGEELRRERLKRNLDLQQISRELKIPTRFLEAIEEDQFHKLPGALFAKSFVRQYARMLGLDEEELGAEVSRVIEPPAEPAAAQSKEAPLIEAKPTAARRWDRLGEESRASSWWARLAGVVALTLVCSGIYALWQRTRSGPPSTAPSAAVDTRRPAQTAAAPAAPVVEPAATAPNAGPASADRGAEPVTTPVAGPLPQQATAQDSAAPVHVSLTAQEPVWIRARSDGKYVFSGTLEPNQTRTVDANGQVELRLGNAGGVEIALNGKPIGAVGPKGQVRTVQLSSGGFKIVSSPSPAVPSDPL